MRYLRALSGVLLACSLLAASGTAHAARRTGLANNLLIEDKDDLFIFPQLLTQYRNLIALDYGPSAGTGNAVLTLGDPDMAFGVALHRGDVLAPHIINEIGASADLNSLFDAPFDTRGTPATLVDFLLGMGGAESAWGLRASIGRGADTTTTGDMDTGESEMFLMAEVGYGAGTRGRDTRFDISGAVTLDFGSQEMAGMDSASGTAFGLSGLLRAYTPMDATMDLGWIGNVAFGTNSVTTEDAPMEFSNTDIGFQVQGGVGPAFRFGSASVAAYGMLGVAFVSIDPNSEVDDEAGEGSDHQILLPGVKIAAEVPLADWLFIRTGADYRYLISGASRPPIDDSESVNASTFSWNAGFGFVVDDFRFDGALQHNWLLAGPDFIGGSATGFLAIASISFNFDRYRSGVTPAETTEPTPVAPPEPAPAPAPALEPAPPPPEPSAENPELGVGVSGGVSGGVQTPPNP